LLRDLYATPHCGYTCLVMPCPHFHAHFRVRVSVLVCRHVSCYYFYQPKLRCVSKSWWFSKKRWWWLSIYAVSAKFADSAISELIQQKYATLWPDADRIWTLTGIWFLSCGSGAHFDRCAYNIDLTQYWILEYTFSRWLSNSCAVSAKTCWVSKNTRRWLSKIYRVSKNLLSQQKSADSAKNMLPQQKFAESAKWSDLAKIRYVSKNLLTGKCLVITQQHMLSKNLLSQHKSTDSRRDLSRSTTT